jgi:hypothetical protein
VNWTLWPASSGWLQRLHMQPRRSTVGEPVPDCLPLTFGAIDKLLIAGYVHLARPGANSTRMKTAPKFLQYLN